MITVYEALGPAIKWNDRIEVLNAFQHDNQEPIQPCEIKDLSTYPKIELLVADKNMSFMRCHKDSSTEVYGEPLETHISCVEMELYGTIPVRCMATIV
jgi:hypothetical protein